jgi:hypothetical protein
MPRAEPEPWSLVAKFSPRRGSVYLLSTVRKIVDIRERP